MRVLLFCCALLISSFASTHQLISALELPQIQQFINQMVDKHGFVREELEYLFKYTQLTVKEHQKIVNPSGKKWKPLNWTKYRSLFLTEKRINAGVEFILEHKNDLKKAYSQYGVSPYIIAAILGIETNYGQFLGEYPTLQTLSALSFGKNHRQAFYKKELENFLLMVRENNMQPFRLKGSHAGALGMAQFISSSYNHYAVDFDEDGKIDLFEPTDSIGSIANYFKKHYWQYQGDLFIPVEPNSYALTKTNKPTKTAKEWRSLGVSIDKDIADDIKLSFIKVPTDEGHDYFLTFWNFYVITRYNHNNMYALATVELASALKTQLLQRK